MTVKSDSFERKLNLDTPLTALFTLNWENVLYTAIFLVALFTHFYDLGTRVMSHDESLHTLYSWNLYAGKGYQHDPLMHGPFLFHINALIYFLFGDNDFTARISTALFGVILVILPYWFRPWLGRIGALSASLMILISPGLTYYSRYIRHDIFVSVWTVLMVLAFFQYMRTRGTRWLFVGAVSVALMLSTKEVAYIHGFIGVTFIGVTYLWESVSTSKRQALNYGLWGFVFILVAGIAYLVFQADALTVVPAEGETGGFNPWKVAGVMVMIAGLLIGLLIIQLGADRTGRPVTLFLQDVSLPAIAKVAGWGALLILFVLGLISGLLLALNGLLSLLGLTTSSVLDLLPFTPGVELPGGILSILLCGSLLYLFWAAIMRRIESQWQIPIVRTVYAAALVAVITFVLLHTTFFTNISGLYTGTIGEVTYWLAQQEVQRGGQPWYYYLFLVPLYEFLPLFVGVVGGLIYIYRRKFPAYADSSVPQPAKPKVRRQRGRTVQTIDSEEDSSADRPSDGGTFVAFVIYWTLVAFVIYSWAGEKMPWLTVHMTLPLIFLAAHVIQTVLGNFNWAEARQRGGLLLGGVLLLVPAALVSIISAQPFRSQSLQSINDTLQFIAGIVILTVLGWGIWVYAKKLGRALAARTAFVTALFIMAFLTIRFMWLLNYVNFDYVNELLVYAHASPDVKLALNQIDEISRRTVGDKMIRVAYDNDSTWPLEWYMREYPNRVYYGENPTRDAMDSPVVIVGAANESKVEPYLGDEYTRFNYRLVWWPIEDYKDQTLQKLWQNYVTGPPVENPTGDTVESQEARRAIARENRQKLWDIIFYRDYEDYDLNEWPFVHRFNVFIRNDVLGEVWDYRSGPAQFPTIPEIDPIQLKRTETDALDLWGSNGSGDGQFVAPRDVAVGPDGSIYVADSGNHRIQVFDQEGNFLLKWGSEGSQPGQFNEPWGIAVSQDGTVFVADTWNHRVQSFTPTGQFLNSFGTFANVQHDAQAEPGSFWGPRDIAIDAQGNLYVTDTGNKRVQKFTPDGQFLQAWGGGGIIPGSFEEPVGIDIDSQDNIYVADTWNQRIQKFDADFNPVLQWDVSGWESESVANKPYLAVDNQGRVFISDPEGYRIIAYDGESGDAIVTWGRYGQELFAFGLPVGITVDSEGHLLVADSDNNRVMKFLVPSLDSAE